MKRIPIKTLSRLILLVTGSLILSAPLVSQEIHKGIWYYQQKQYISAKRTLLACIDKDTTNALAMFYAGQVYFLLDNTDSARYYYNRGIRINPKEPLNFIGAGKLFLKQSDRVNCVKMFDKGKKVADDPANYFIEAALACLSAGPAYYDLVGIYLNAASEESSENPALYIAFGDFYLQSKTPGEAVNEYERAIYYDKNCVEACLDLGDVYSRANNFRDGLNELNKAIEIDPGQIIGYKLRGDLYYNFAKYQEARADYDIFMQRGDRTLEDQQKYVYILFFSKDYERAGTLIDMLLNSNPDLSILYRIKAYIDYETGDYTDGLKNLETFFRNHDTTRFIAQDFAYYGRLLMKNNQDSLGIIQVEKALIMDSTKVELYEELAKSYAKVKQFEKSIEMYDKMLIVNPVNLQNIYYQIGRNYYFLAEDTLVVIDSVQRTLYYAMADSNFSKLTQVSPDSYIGFIWRGRIHSKLDPETSAGLAKPDYEQAMALLEKGDVSKTPKLLLECYRYLAFYYYLLADKSSGTDPSGSKTAMNNSIDYWKKVLALDPNDTQAKTALDNLKVE